MQSSEKYRYDKYSPRCLICGKTQVGWVLHVQASLPIGLQLSSINLSSLHLPSLHLPSLNLTKQVHYKLQDPLPRFWFRFVYPNGSAIYQMDEKNAFMNLIEPYLESYFGYCYEILCRDTLGLLYRKEGLTCSYEIGEYWDKDVQIDQQIAVVLY